MMKVTAFSFHRTESPSDNIRITFEDDYDDIPASDVDYHHWYFISGPDAEEHNKRLKAR